MTKEVVAPFRPMDLDIAREAPIVRASMNRVAELKRHTVHMCMHKHMRSLASWVG
jgi:hypothetical protein